MSKTIKRFEVEDIHFSEYSAISDEYGCRSATVEIDKQAIEAAVSKAGAAYASLATPFELRLESHIAVTLLDDDGDVIEIDEELEIKATAYVCSEHVTIETVTLCIQLDNKNDLADRALIQLSLSE